MNNFHQVSSLALLGSLALISPFSAVAQQDFALEEIVVTAQKREQSVQDVPIAITAFNQSDLERLNASDLSDLQYSTPNLTIATNTKVTPRVGMRGISDFSRNPGYDNRVSVYVDGMYAGRSAASNQATLDIERIEVLRGPQGTLFGKNTVAGAISLTSRKPTEEFNASAKLDIGNESYTSITGMVNGALIEDTLMAKIMVNDQQKDGYKTHLPSGDDLSGTDKQSARVQLRWMLEQGEVNFSYDKTTDDNDGIDAEKIDDAQAPGPFTVATDAPLTQFIETQGVALTVDYDFDNDFSLTSITGLRQTEYNSTLDEDYSPLDVATSTVTEDSEHFSQELRLASPVNDNYDYVLGLYYFEQTNESKSSASGGIYFPTYNADTNPNPKVEVPATVDVSSYAAFFHGNYRITEKLELTGGLRYTYEKKDLSYSISDTTFLFTNGDFNDTRDAEDLSPKIGLNFYLNEDILIYGGYSKAFKSGGWNVDFISTFDQINFDDEQVDAYELGFKSTLADGRVRFNAALYHSNYSDFQVFQFVPVSTGGTILSITNAAEVTAKGFEADVNWAMTEHLTLWAGYGFSDSSFDQFKDGGGPGVDYDGNNTPDAPARSYSLGLQFQHSVGDFGEFFASVDYSYRGAFYSNPNNLDVNRIDAYELLNARAGIRAHDDSWSVSLWGKNLADANDMTERSVSFLGVQRAAYLEPRTYGLSLKYKIGQ